MNLFTTVDPRPIHFMGIAGAGMSGLGLLAKAQGVAITGCDNDPTGAADLAAVGVEIWRGHDPGHVAGARAAVSLGGAEMPGSGDASCTSWRRTSTTGRFCRSGRPSRW